MALSYFFTKIQKNRPVLKGHRTFNSKTIETGADYDSTNHLIMSIDQEKGSVFEKNKS